MYNVYNSILTLYFIIIIIKTWLIINEYKSNDVQSMTTQYTPHTFNTQSRVLKRKVNTHNNYVYTTTTRLLPTTVIPVYSLVLTTQIYINEKQKHTYKII